MRIITLNMKMFNLHIDNSLNDFLAEYTPDVAIIQECRPSKSKNIYNNRILPNNFDNEIDGRYYTTMAFCKEQIWDRVNVDNLGKYDRSYVAIKAEDFSVLGIHVPAERENNKQMLRKFISKIEESNSDIICGDFNASSKKPESINNELLKNLEVQKKYSNLWAQGLENNKAYYIDYKGKKQKADSNIRTFVGNTHIDYMFGKKIELKEIIIDMRTLAFTDHCAIIIDCDRTSISYEC